MPRTDRLGDRENINIGRRKFVLWMKDPIDRLDEDSYDLSPAIFAEQDPSATTDVGPALILGADGSVWTMAYQGTPRQVIGASGGIDLNGLADGLVLDADGDTSISSDTDDQINFELNSLDTFIMKAVPAANHNSTVDLFEIAFTSPVNTTSTNVLNGLTIDIEIGNASGGTNTVRAVQIDGVTADAQVTDEAVNIGAGWTTAFKYSGDAARSIVLGIGEDDIIGHNGTHSTWTHATGDLIFDNVLVTGSTIARLGTDTTAVSFEVQNNSEAILFSVTPSSASAGTALVAGVLDLNGTLDQDAALTAAGNAADVAATLNHATAAAYALAASIATVTTVHSSGIVGALKATFTSLAGDTGGDFVGLHLSSVDGGGTTPFHSGIYSDTALDALIKVSADGMGGVVVGATMTRSPESDTESGYFRFNVGATVYQVPIYAA
jgi:hypothetical protein